MPHTIFYWDKSQSKGEISPKERKMALELVKSSSYEDVSACAVEGFESGIDWAELVRRGAQNVILVDVNQAGAGGVMWEAENEGMKAYELFNGKLFRLNSQKVELVGKEVIEKTPATV